MRSAPSKKDRNLWCRYHNDHSHTIDNCKSLKRAIEALIKRGHLRGYINRRNEKREANPLAEREEVQENTGVINTIPGGIAVRGSSGQGRKAYAREVFTTVGPSTKKQKIEPTPTISFSDDDVGDTRIPHDDPLVVTLRVGNFDMKRILLDNGSSAEVLFYEAFQKMNILPDRLRRIDTPLYGFSNHPVVCEGIIMLPGTVGASPTQAKLMLDFVVAKNFEWTKECQKSFEELKLYLSSPPLLTKPVIGEDLFLYLSISEVAVSTVLIREEEGKQRPVYYISKVLQDVETRYPRIDKVALALVISARKLRPYFQSHTVVVLTDQPLGKVLQSPDASGILVNWSVELGEFDIKYKPRTTINAQALSDFVVECTIPDDTPQLILSEVSDPWILYVDDSSKVGSSGVGLILISPESFMIEYALRFNF
ncbi:hypothetical protein RJ639_030290 [Escallonia herrerae]|uniref:Reverse transcriptase/retrotransposon-derived protein RNase H-like domain-containing protein n=1 Tax=Escallonia herrerae TaxID=1293975 RepID=A0AA88XGN6_9ASTE|nr:hypothetical protein RJ639_030290 [Escallonia herrerae]